MSQQIQIKPGKYEDVMPDMSDEEYETLKESIRRNGFDETTPIIVDQDGDIVDGHHRFKACEELGVEPSFIQVDDPTIEQAYRVNLARRDLQDGTKREIVRRYLKDRYKAERTLEDVAADLGVSAGTVSKAKGEVEQSVKSSDREWFTTDEKRQIVRGYIEANPDAKNREVARNVEPDVTHPTVGKWREEFEAEAEEEDEDELAAQIVAENFEDQYADNHEIANRLGCSPGQVEAVLGKHRLGSLDESIKDRAREIVDSRTPDPAEDEPAPETKGDESSEESGSSEPAETDAEAGEDETDTPAQPAVESDEDDSETEAIACPVCNQHVLLLDPDGTEHTCDPADIRERA